jgi:hypothetical protein
MSYTPDKPGNGFSGGIFSTVYSIVFGLSRGIGLTYCRNFLRGYAPQLAF